MPKHFLSILDLSRVDIESILDRASILKFEKQRRIKHETLSGSSIGIIFEKVSTRTRVSFEVGIHDLGAYPLYMNSDDLQLGRGETVADTARVLSSYLDGVIIRTYEQSRIEEFALYSSVPVVNALTNDEHPTQIVSDLFTIRENGIDLDKLKITYIGDGNNILNSLIGVSLLLGFELSIACPKGYHPSSEFIKKVKNNGKLDLVIGDDPVSLIKSADVIYTDVWVSMGQEDERKERLKRFKPFQLDGKLLKKAKKDVLVMHCLPAHRGEEITDSVVDGKNSIVFEQAENKLHVGKAILEHFIR